MQILTDLYNAVVGFFAWIYEAVAYAVVGAVNWIVQFCTPWIAELYSQIPEQYQPQSSDLSSLLYYVEVGENWFPVSQFVSCLAGYWVFNFAVLSVKFAFKIVRGS